jgi:hypothetical protein
MKTSNTDRTTAGTARRRGIVAGVLLALLTMTACVRRPGYAGGSTTSPRSQCRDFGCEQ